MSAKRVDPYLSCSFLVEVDQCIRGGFSDVTGLQVEVETEAYQEGGVNDFVHQLPKGVKYAPLVLKRGFSDNDVLWNWHQDIVRGVMTTKTIRIIQLDARGQETVGWECLKAFPIKWSGPDFRSQDNSVGFESVDFVHAGIKRM